MPGVAVVTRFMKSRGLVKQRTPRKRRDADNAPVFEARERRSFEVGHVRALGTRISTKARAAAAEPVGAGLDRLLDGPFRRPIGDEIPHSASLPVSHAFEH